MGLPPNDGTRYHIIVDKDGEFVWTNKKNFQDKFHEPSGWKHTLKVKVSCLNCKQTIHRNQFERHYKACVKKKPLVNKSFPSMFS